MERDILADVNHPFIVKLNYGTFTIVHRRMLITCCNFLFHKYVICYLLHNVHEAM